MQLLTRRERFHGELAEEMAFHREEAEMNLLGLNLSPCCRVCEAWETADPGTAMQPSRMVFAVGRGTFEQSNKQVILTIAAGIRLSESRKSGTVEEHHAPNLDHLYFLRNDLRDPCAGAGACHRRTRTRARHTG